MDRNQEEMKKGVGMGVEIETGRISASIRVLKQ